MRRSTIDAPKPSAVAHWQHRYLLPELNRRWTYVYIYYIQVQVLWEYHREKLAFSNKGLSVIDACASTCAFEEKQAHYSRICSITLAVRAWKISRIKLRTYDSWLSLGAPRSAPSSIDLQSIQWVFWHLQVTILLRLLRHSHRDAHILPPNGKRGVCVCVW